MPAQQTPRRMRYSAATLIIIISYILTIFASISVSEADDASYPPFVLQERFRKGELDAVHDHLMRLTTRSRTDFAAEEELYATFVVLGSIGRAGEPILNDFVKKFPKSGLAHLTRAFYNLQEVWFSRGYGLPDTIPIEGANGIPQYIKAAFSDALEAISQNPQLALAHLVCMEVISITGSSPEKGLTPEHFFKKYLELNPKSFVIRYRFMRFSQPRWGGSYEAMKKISDEAQSHVAENPRLRLLPGFILADQAHALTSQKNYDDAIGKLFPEIGKYAALPDYVFWLGDAYYHKNDYANALKFEAQARALVPYNDMYIAATARAKKYLNNLEGMKSDIDFLKKIAPDSHEIRTLERSLSKGNSYEVAKQASERLNAGDVQQALVLINQAIAKDSKNGSYFYLRAKIQSKTKQFPQALTDAIKSVELEPDSFKSVQFLDWLLAREGNYDEVTRHWSNYISLKPNDGAAYHERGGAYFHGGKAEQAKADLIKSCELGHQPACALKRQKGW